MFLRLRKLAGRTVLTPNKVTRNRLPRNNKALRKAAVLQINLSNQAVFFGFYSKFKSIRIYSLRLLNKSYWP